MLEIWRKCSIIVAHACRLVKARRACTPGYPLTAFVTVQVTVRMEASRFADVGVVSRMEAKVTWHRTPDLWGGR